MLHALNSLSALFSVQQRPEEIFIPHNDAATSSLPASPTTPTSQPTTPVSAATEAQSSTSSPSTHSRTNAVASLELVGQPHEISAQDTAIPQPLRNRLRPTNEETSSAVLPRIVILTSTLASPFPSRMPTQVLRLTLPQTAPRNRETHHVASLRGLVPLVNLLQALNAQKPTPHLLHIKEIKEFSKQYLDHMIAAKNDLLRTNVFSEDEIMDIDVAAISAISWLGLLHLVQQGELITEDAKEGIVFRKKINERLSEAKLTLNPDYVWLTKDLIATKKIVATLTEEQLRALKKRLTYKESAAAATPATSQATSKSQTVQTPTAPKEAEKQTFQKTAPVTADTQAYRLITELKLKIDKKIVNPYDPSTHDHELPEENRIPWAQAFGPLGA